MESNIAYLAEAIQGFFELPAVNLPVALAPVNKSPSHRRHSVIRLAGKKGTSFVKEMVKVRERRNFGWVLKMDEKCEPYAKEGIQRDRYEDRKNDPDYAIIKL